MIGEDRLDRLDRSIAHAFQGRKTVRCSEDFEQRVMQDIRNRVSESEQRYFIRHVCRPMLAVSALAAVLLLLVLALGDENRLTVNPYSYFNQDLIYTHSSWIAANGG